MGATSTSRPPLSDQTGLMLELSSARRFVDGIAASMGLGDRVHRPGTTVVPSAARSGSSSVVLYAIAEHAVLWCDPALAADLAVFADDSITVSLDEIQSILTGRAWEHLGRSRMLLPPTSGLTIGPIVVPEAMAVRSFDVRDPADRAAVESFAARLSPDDREDADLDGDEFDDHIVAVVEGDGGGGIVALASQRPFEYADGFGDIAVATLADARGRGLGRLAVAVLCGEIEALGLVPLYRRGQANTGSVRLCASLGFVAVVEVDGIRRPIGGMHVS